MKELLDRIEALEKRIAVLERRVASGRQGMDWKTKAKIGYDKNSDMTAQEIARKYNISVPLVYKIGKARNAAEVEFEKTTGLTVAQNLNTFAEWRSENL